MKIIQAHNYYQIAGGEDTVVAVEKKLLEENGNEVIPYYKKNESINGASLFDKISLLKKATWSKDTFLEFKEILRIEKPDICHVHNFMPLISPAIYDACQEMNVPVVQTLHNYRLICTNGLFLREGKACESCLGKSAYGAVLKKCYRDSAIQTYAVSRMLEKNKQKGTWKNSVDGYICLTEFAKQKFVKHGLPAQKISIKANSVSAIDALESDEQQPYFIFVGRLIESKGVKLLIEIASTLKIPVKLVGEGDLQSELSDIPNIELCGKLPYQDTLKLINKAKALILPSLCYEGMPMTILEAFSMKTPVVTSGIGAMESMIEHKKNGLLFAAGNANELKDSLTFVLDNPKVMTEIKRAAFLDFEKKYAPKANYNALMEIYRNLIQIKKK